MMLIDFGWIFFNSDTCANWDRFPKPVTIIIIAKIIFCKECYIIWSYSDTGALLKTSQFHISQNYVDEPVQHSRTATIVDKTLIYCVCLSDTIHACCTYRTVHAINIYNFIYNMHGNFLRQRKFIDHIIMIHTLVGKNSHILPIYNKNYAHARLIVL